MNFPRTVAAETLDGLRANDPAARRARLDLQRVHGVMGTRAILLRALLDMTPQRNDAAPLRVLELGAGDGSLMLGIARAARGRWPGLTLALLDRVDLVDRATIARYAEAGWAVSTLVTDVLDWAAEPPANKSVRWDLIVANLFLHHFEGAQLATLLAAIESRSERFFACEPRRTWLALSGSHLIGAIGANAVTRADAVLSVHAGFRDAELTALWPARAGRWTLDEYPAGLFSHCLRAERNGTH